MDDFELAAALVRDAGALAARMLGEGLTVERKTSISDVVSAADHAAEAFVVERLRRERPDDAIVGEEGTADAGAAARTWYVDPVDGTYNFVSGLPAWCAAVARDDAVGAVHQPATGETWVGGAGRPTTRNGERVAPLGDRALADISLTTYLHPTTLPDPVLREPWLRVVQGAATVRMLGSGSIELAAVAAGRLGVSVQVDSLPWDWLPGAVLVRAAGGVAEVIEAHGHRWHVAGPGRAVDEVTALLTG
ncbi:fructose-1,6-bisphosphatase [Jatrophihabitans endophyticus]|uniref:Fructose-1,6-bisphosphatase n=1 Tax=Jatrophihabitans endophyticus TaxID=1206085 RepID=A0A1M5R2I9_9ACTN|nr:inositol monophosphatase [Jatrophihabitans endophyticus]SHH20411.1 fructose-1,6-bisphosphatase [Jatrophihabitans endophyticus]